MSTQEQNDVNIDLDHLRTWIGKVTEAEDIISVRHARLMAASLGLPQSDFVAGAQLPPLWHWLYFLEGLPPSELGRDGHPARGGFLPPVPLANRMWAGGNLEFLQPLLLGSTVRKRSYVKSVDHKQGRSGHLVFVTVRHELYYCGELAVVEDHDIVYKPPTRPGAARPTVPVDLPKPTHSETFEATSTLLFRYSALTFNGHRIHYDQDYCREVEGYSNLVVHGPLQATLLAALAQRLAPTPIKHFRYRGVQPNLLGTPLVFHASQQEQGFSLWSAMPDGAQSMQAEANY
ncbi:FAS1-like dehydratase domain-containing protein [Delftia sp. ZNC0008]|jgi:3-methylfumaryl-CoA hydratase|uniref:FAS1-like dehydratase domain-containing protein n=1 Tax=Delftia sp. ZNC0008 TaxID=1339242 RepID=UPI000646C36E|nr:MaoC family dehydratase N-terminal domain-containing protein [Delftia sp. ZNC0008]